MQKEKNSKIDVNNVRDYQSKNEFLRRASAGDIAGVMDELKVFQSILSKDLPPERYNGILDLRYVIFYQNATSNEIKSALVKCVQN